MDVSTSKAYVQQYINTTSPRKIITGVYIAILTLLLLVVNLYSISSIKTNEVESFGIFAQGIGRSNVLIIVILALLIGWNFLPKLRDLMYKALGFSGHDGLVSAGLLFVLLSNIVGLGDTISFISTSYSNTLSTTLSYNIVSIVIVLGIGYFLISSYLLQQKQRIHTSGQNTAEIDQSQAEAFKKIEKEFGGLFADESGQHTTSRDH